MSDATRRLVAWTPFEVSLKKSSNATNLWPILNAGFNQSARRNRPQKILQLTPREPGAFGIAILGGAPDHPMTINFPEGDYLKGLVLMRK